MYDYSVIAGGHTSIISDAKNWPAMKGKKLSGYQKKKVWINDAVGHFSDVAQTVGYTDTHDGRAVVLVDLWNRGALDVVVAVPRAFVELAETHALLYERAREYTEIGDE